MSASVLDASLLRGLIARWTYRLGLHGTLGATSYAAAGVVGLPRPLVIAFASDFHAGPSTDPRIFESLEREIVSRRPDLLLLGGDFVSHRARDIHALCGCLAACGPPLGKYAVLGNHDLWTDERHIIDALSSCGVRVLVNANVRLPEPFHGVSICGLDDAWTGEANAAAAFQDAEPIRILLMHSPDGLQYLDKESYEVAFAGHTHGGQIAKADGAPRFFAGGPLSRRYSYGEYQIPGRGRLIVSRGVGCTNLPIRINADPELVLLTLQPVR